jgi:quinol monooxygenase YgiN
MIHVIATVTARPGQRAAVVDAFCRAAPAVRAKPGCLQYDLALPTPSGLPGQAAYEAGDLVVVEQWTSLADLVAHLGDEQYRAWYLQVHPCLSRASMQVLDAVEDSREEERWKGAEDRPPAGEVA